VNLAGSVISSSGDGDSVGVSIGSGFVNNAGMISGSLAGVSLGGGAWVAALDW
jgi:hypothetical protein